MQTARITLIVDYVGGTPAPYFHNRHTGNTPSAQMTMDNCTILGTPEVQVDKHHRCAMSAQSYQLALGRMLGSENAFAKTLAQLLQLADEPTRIRLINEFHDLIWSWAESSPK